jgi:hypothetical protein
MYACHYGSSFACIVLGDDTESRISVLLDQYLSIVRGPIIDDDDLIEERTIEYCLDHCPDARSLIVGGDNTRKSHKSSYLVLMLPFRQATV